MNLYGVKPADGTCAQFLQNQAGRLVQAVGEIDRENKTFSLALYTSLFDAGLGLGSPLFGWISDLSGYRVMYFVAGMMLLVFVTLFTIKSPSLSIKI